MCLLASVAGGSVTLKGRLTGFLGISHCSLRSPNRVCNIGWAENGPGAVLCSLIHPVIFSWEKKLGFLILRYSHEYIDQLRADWLVSTSEAAEQRRNRANSTH